METYEALGLCVGRDTVAHAKALRRSTALVNKWTEPTNDFEDSGALNPLDRLEMMIETARRVGKVSPTDAIAPIQYLANRFNLALIPLPANIPCLTDVTHQLMVTIKEFGDLAAVSAAAMEDCRITPDERRIIEREGNELLAAVGLFLKVVAEAAQ